MSEFRSPSHRALAPELLPIACICPILALDLPFQFLSICAASLEIFPEQQGACCDACKRQPCQSGTCLRNPSRPSQF